MFSDKVNAWMSTIRIEDPDRKASVMESSVTAMISGSGTLGERLSSLHQQLLETVPSVDRIACAIYESSDGSLKTFINSTRTGKAIAGYEYKLADSHSLSELARTGNFRVLDDIASAITADTAHSKWLLEQGYQSSFTVPLFDSQALLGFVFFDSVRTGAFPPPVQRDLVLYSSLIGMSITGELTAVRTLVEATRVARALTVMRDFETGRHLDRMARYSRIIARKVAPRHGRDDEFIEMVYLFAPLHDIGKIGIPDRILLKQGPLDPEERRIMESHVEKGVQMIDRTIGTSGTHQLPSSQVLHNIVSCHHELLDGSGYPQKRMGADVPLEGRIVTVSDIFDALTSRRPYKDSWSNEQAFAELRRMVALGKLDGECVEALIDSPDEVREVQQRFGDHMDDAEQARPA